MPRERSSTRQSRAERTQRTRRRAAILLVGALAVGWIATSRAGHASGSVTAPPAVSASPSTDSIPSSVTSTTAETAPAPRRVAGPSGRLRSLLPAGARCDARSSTETRCTVAGIAVEYRLMGPDVVQRAYLASLVPGLSGGSTALGTGSGPPACARGGEEERAWSRPGAPRLVAGRYACRIEEGRAAMWWTVADHGLLAHANASDADLTSLFAWWASHSER